MIESPLLEEFVADRVRAMAQRNILAVLETRFGGIPQDLAEQIQSVADEDRLTDLVRKAASCADLEVFRRETQR